MKNKIAAFAIITTALTASTSNLVAGLTDTEELALVKATVPYATRLASASAWPTAGTSPLTDELDGAKFGAASETANSQTYWYNDNDTDVYTMSSVGDAWRTLKHTGIAATWNATTTLTFTETVRDGNAPGGGAYTLELTVTKTGTPADLTKAEVLSFLASNKSKALTLLTGTGTSLGTVKVGWAATALVKDGNPTAIAATLDPMSASFTLPVTIGTSKNLTTTVAKLMDWNLTTASTTKKPVTFSITGYTLTMDFQPSQFARTSGISTGIVNAAKTLENRLISQVTSSSIFGIYNKGTDVVASLKSKAVGTDNNTLSNKIVTDAIAKVTATSFDEAKCQAKSLTEIGGAGEKIFLVYVGGTDVTSVTTAVDDTYFKITGTIGAAEPKTFSVNLSGQDTIAAATNTVLTLTAPDGDVIIIKNFLTTALDASGLALDATGKATALAGYLKAAIGAGAATIVHSSLDELN